MKERNNLLRSLFFKCSVRKVGEILTQYIHMLKRQSQNSTKDFTRLYTYNKYRHQTCSKGFLWRR